MRQAGLVNGTSELHNTIQAQEHVPMLTKCFPDQTFDTVSSGSFPLNSFGYS